MSGRKIRFDDYEVDFDRRELRKGGVRLKLERKPFHVLELLLRRPGELVKREQLVESLWPDSHVSFEHGLNTAVNSLRQVLKDSSHDRHYIETRPGFGYLFTAAVKEVADGNRAGAAIRGEEHNSEAYQDCLKGRYFLDRMAEEEIYKAIAYFRAAASDRTYGGLAQAGITDAYCQLVWLESVRPSQVAAQARFSAEWALRSRPDLPDAHIAQARVKLLFDWDCQSAQEGVNRALALDASSIAALTLHASLLCSSGNYQEAIEACRTTFLSDPLSAPANVQLAASLCAAGDFKTAIDRCWEMLTLAPSLAPAQLLLARCYEQLGMHDEAIIEFQNARRCAGFEAAATCGFGHVFAVEGRESEAEQAFAELARLAESRYVSPYCYAVLCVGRRQIDQAIAYLEDSLSVRDPALLWLLSDPRFQILRNDERFQKLLYPRSNQQPSGALALWRS